MQQPICPDDRFLEEGYRIIKEAEQRGIILRLLGSVAVKIHCPKYGYLYDEADRPLTDLDFMTYSRFNAEMQTFFKDLDYSPDEGVLRYFGKYRHIYYSNSIEGLHIDIFFDQLSFCHPVDFQGKLESDRPTIPITEILLEKMQIVKINEKDLKDTIILMREHEIGGIGSEKINGDFIAKRLSNDWGFYYTFLTSINKVNQYLRQFAPLSGEDRRIVSGRVDQLKDLIENQPKSLKWKLRAKVGTRVRWYQEVEEVDR